MEKKLEKLISELTLDEKLHLLASGSGGVERLGIGDCRLGGEAAHGVEARNDQNHMGEPEITTSFPEPVGMCSSWDREAIKAAGGVVGKEARAIYNKRPWGGLSRWAPTVDLLRDPRWGRNEEGYSEDPVLAGAMASEYIRGIQGPDKEKLMAASTLKHFYANNTEIGRGWKNSTVSPRNKFELYLEPFRRCIEDGGAEGVMTAYNRINGVQGLFCEDVRDILKGEFGLTHAVSDGGAMELTAAFSHATAMDAETIARSVKAGVDAMSGWPEGVYKAAKEAYELGLLTEEDIDTAIKNVYRTKIRLGLFDDTKREAGELVSPEAHAACKALTDSSLVLLKNNGILPLKEGSLKDCVLIGPVGDKWFPDWYGGAAPEHVTLLDGLNEITEKEGLSLGGTFVDGCDRIRLKCGNSYLKAAEEERVVLSDTPDTFVLEDWGEGSFTLRNVRTGKYMNTRLSGDPIIGIATAEGASGNTIAGKVYADGERIFSWFDLEVFRIEKGDTTVILRDRFGNRIYADKDGNLVSAGADYEGLTLLTFEIETVRSGIEEAVAAASKAGTVILALGHSPMINAKEEVDRATIDFIPYQQKLFDEIYKVNPHTAVVLMSDYSFAINDINDRAEAILWSATGSQCMGRSIADALVGRVHPAGRLSQTWYRSDQDIPDIDDYDIIGTGRTYRYFEGKVLYPFGYGLTYTKFKYSDLKVTIGRGAAVAKADAAVRRFGQPSGVYDEIRRDDRTLEIELAVTNTGDTVSDEVAEIYAKAPKGRVKRPLKQLIGFERVKDITPGEVRKVSFSIPVRELCYYDVISEKLVVAGGRYEILAGPSSEDIQASFAIEIEGGREGLRDLSGKVKADHFDKAEGIQIVEGLYGYSAVAAAGNNVCELERDGRFSVTYGNCDIKDEAHTLRLHAFAPQDATLRISVDGRRAAELTLNTKDYEKNPSEARNHMPRAVVDEAGRKESWPLLWANVRIPLDLKDLPAAESGKGHTITIEAEGPVKFDWFSVVGE